MKENELHNQKEDFSAREQISTLIQSRPEAKLEYFSNPEV
jgi:hypothetical protein